MPNKDLKDKLIATRPNAITSEPTLHDVYSGKVHTDPESLFPTLKRLQDVIAILDDNGMFSNSNKTKFNTSYRLTI